MLILIRTERVVKRSAVQRGPVPDDNPNFLLADNSLRTVHQDLVSLTGSASEVFGTSCSRERLTSSLFLFRIWLRVFDSVQSFFGTLVPGIEL